MDHLRQELMYECTLCTGEDPDIFLELFGKAIDLFPPMPYIVETQTAISHTIMEEWFKKKSHPLDAEFRKRTLTICVDVLRATSDPFFSPSP